MDETAAHTLDKITDGARVLVALTLSRLREAESAIERGNFSEAFSRLREAQHKLGAVAQAEDNLAVMAGHAVARAEQVVTGDELYGYGEVTGVERNHDCCSVPDHFAVELTFVNGVSETFASDQEVLISVET